MVFSSFVFIVLFLPVFLALYYLCPARHRNWCALAGSVVFYAWGAPRFLPILLASCLTDFLLGRAIERAHGGPPRRRRLLLALAVGINLVFFLYFKYANFLVHETSRLLLGLGLGKIAWVKVALPVGISFITFHKISYLVDVSRGAVHAARTFRDYLLYILLFPQLIAGPILRYHWMADQLAHRVLDGGRIQEGIVRFCRGLAKKVLIANPLGEVADRAFAARLGELPGEYAWIGIACYSFQIFFDFSGYSDMALGLGRMMGFEFVENFNHPYVSRNFTEFWRRWHISLSSWMREYLYIPLGGNRVGTLRQYLNLWIVFLLSGFWHGASWNFVAWGAWHGLFLTLDKALARTRWALLPRWFAVPLTFALVSLGWVLFRARDLGHAVGYVGRLVDPHAYGIAISPFPIGEFIGNRALAMLAVAAILSFLPLLRERLTLAMEQFPALLENWLGGGVARSGGPPPPGPKGGQEGELRGSSGAQSDCGPNEPMTHQGPGWSEGATANGRVRWGCAATGPRSPHVPASIGPCSPHAPESPGLWRYASALLLFGLACAGLATAQFNPFIYFRF